MEKNVLATILDEILTDSARSIRIKLDQFKAECKTEILNEIITKTISDDYNDGYGITLNTSMEKLAGCNGYVLDMMDIGSIGRQWDGCVTFVISHTDIKKDNKM